MKQLSIFDYDKNGELKEESKYSDLYNKILDMKPAYEHVDKVDFWKDRFTEVPMWTAMFGDLSTAEGQARYKEYISRIEDKIKARVDEIEAKIKARESQRKLDDLLLKFFKTLMEDDFNNIDAIEMLKDCLLTMYENKVFTESEHCDIENYLDSFLRRM